MDSQKTLETIKKLEFKTITDTRGFGMEILSRLVSCSIGSPEFKHIYVSFSRKGVIRGLHYQLPPKAQGKLVAVIIGEIFDVVVDIRRSSNDFGKYMILKLRSGEGVWIPPGFAHGFQALNDSVVLYLMTDSISTFCVCLFSFLISSFCLYLNRINPDSEIIKNTNTKMIRSNIFV